MNNYKIISFALLAIIMLPVSVIKAEEAKLPSVRVVCVDTQLDQIMKTLALKLAMSDNQAMDFSLAKSGHYKAIKSILAGEADIGVLTVKPLYKYRRRGLTVKPFAVYPVVWAVNKVNPVFGMTSDQLRKIYTGKIDKWKIFNNTDFSLHLFGMKIQTPIMNIFQKKLMKDTPISVPIYASSRGIELPDLIENNMHGLACMPYLPLKKQAKVKYLNIDAVKPTPANFLSGKYPYCKVFYLAYKGDHSKAVDLFLKYLKSPSMQNIFSNAGYVLY
jgi:phosphate transport system substrate-binding protein